MIKPAPASAAATLTEFRAALRRDRLLFFPVRHHSPACAWHLQEFIRREKPASILIEGPETFDAFIPHLVSSETTPPVAVYAHLVEKVKADAPPADKNTPRRASTKPRRHGSFYPLCDYSPEWIALREGHAIGAKLSFFDLDHPRMVKASQSKEQEDSPRPISLFDESYFHQNDYLQALARQRGCRDFHELWDRLFESAFRAGDTENFIEQVASYCWFARTHTPDSQLEKDGTLVREFHMWNRLQKEQRRLKRRGETRPLLVVTGGFHTPALALGWPRQWNVNMPDFDRRKAEVLEAIVPYSFEQLDALHGYAAGMPSPGYYQRVWQSTEPDTERTHQAVAAKFLTELPRQLRANQTACQLSTADSIAALTQATLLARVRSNPGPMREDLLDAMQSCFVKGELDVEGRLIFDLALELMRGDGVGRVPPDAALHPLVSDFRTQAETLGLALQSSIERELDLEIYRKPRHQAQSLFLHRLDFLEVPFGEFTSGPDLVSGTDLDLQREHWCCRWSPQTEAALIDRSLEGTSIKEACLYRLHRRLAKLSEDRSDLGAPDAALALTLAISLGLFEHLDQFMSAARDRLQTESNFERGVSATTQLHNLQRFRSPTTGDHHSEIKGLANEAYQRACLLMQDIATAPAEKHREVLDALTQLQEIVANDEAGTIDASLFWDTVKTLADGGRAPAMIQGGLIGLLSTRAGHDPDAILDRIYEALLGFDQQGSTAPALLLGLFTVCRELSWQTPELMQRLDTLFNAWGEEEFNQALPHLRLAFAQHTPRETDRVAELLQKLHGSESSIDWYQRDHDESFLQENTALAGRVAAALERDGLSHFLPQ